MKKLVNEIITAYGDVKAVQQRFGYKQPMGVYNWGFRGIPKKLIAEIHIDTGIELERLLEGANNQSSSLGVGGK